MNSRLIVHPFPQDLLQRIKSELLKSIHSVERPIAAFDADGTLWTHDAGEQFFDFQIQNNLGNLPADPWKHYEDLQEQQSKEVAYLWLAQTCAGVPLQTVQEWARQCVEQNSPLPIFDVQREIISLLLENNVEVYIVTASVKWAVEPAAAIYNISPDNVIGITTKVKDGVVTEEQSGEITYQEGKVKALLDKTGEAYPLFTAGNTIGDVPLLHAATHHRLVLASASRENPRLFKTEQETIALAKDLGWFHHSYVS